jgi:hypothetical protein
VASLRSDARRRSRWSDVTESPIVSYLDRLDRELAGVRAPRRRLLAEAADHLQASADEIAALGILRSEAERQAVARFGAATVVAQRFAQAAASTSARTAFVWAASAWAGYAVAAGIFILGAPSWLRDFPQGAASMLALQVAAVALLLTAVRTMRFRRALVIDEPRLRLIGNGLVIATAAVAAGAGLELLVALTRPAPAPWGDAANVIAIYAVAGIAALAATFVAVTTMAQTHALAASPGTSGDEVPAVASLVDDVAAIASPLRRVAAFVTSRGVVACIATAGFAFVAMAVTEAWSADYGNHASAVASAAATGLVEAAAVVVAYLTLARALGLRSPRPGAER